MMGTGKVSPGVITPPKDADYASQRVQSPTEEEVEKRELFKSITKPRVRYDVEVVTKLIVYSGMSCNERTCKVYMADLSV
jgi:hypothetical protein